MDGRQYPRSVDYCDQLRIVMDSLDHVEIGANP